MIIVLLRINEVSAILVLFWWFLPLWGRVDAGRPAGCLLHTGASTAKVCRHWLTPLERADNAYLFPTPRSLILHPLLKIDRGGISAAHKSARQGASC